MKNCLKCDFEIDREDYNFCPYCGARLDEEDYRPRRELSMAEFSRAMEPFEYKVLPDDGGYKITKVKSAFITSAIIPRGVTVIGYRAFANCKDMLTVTIPDTVTEISHTAFPGCNKLGHVIFTGDREQWSSIAIGHTNAHITRNRITFLGEACSKDGEEGDESDYDAILAPFATVRDNDFLTVIELKDKEARSVTVPEPFNLIGQDAFKSCHNLESVTITADIFIIKEGVFRDCINLKHIKLPDDLRDIYSYAFENCRSLESLFIPKSAFISGYNIFNGCTSLKTIRFGGTKKAWKESRCPIKNKECLKKVKILYECKE